MTTRGMLSGGPHATCEKCYGHGEEYANDGITKLRCSECEGVGVELTEVGRELVKFLSEHFGLECRKRRE